MELTLCAGLIPALGTINIDISRYLCSAVLPYCRRMANLWLTPRHGYRGSGTLPKALKRRG